MPSIQLSEPFLLSDEGSDRGTAYTLGNKSVTLGEKTHVVWTDRIAKTRGRTFNHASGTWSETIAIGEGCDNHNNPSLTADREGRLHLAYGPHGRWADFPDRWPSAFFKYTVSKLANTLDDLPANHIGRGGAFGYHASYACLMHAPGGFDCIVYRGGEEPHALLFQRQRPRGGWHRAVPLMEQDITPGYTHYGAQVCCDSLGTLYVAGHFYSMARGHSEGCSILRSDDGGYSWNDIHGNPVRTPIRADPRFFIPSADAVHDPRIAGIACDSRNRLWVMNAQSLLTDGRVLLSVFEHSRWRMIDVAAFLPSGFAATLGTFTIDHKDRLHVTIDAVDPALRGVPDKLRDAKHRPKPGAGWWCHPSTEVFHLFSADDGRTFICTPVSKPDPTTSNWMSNISKPGPFHPVTRPLIVWTHGHSGTNPGEGCNSTTKTEVWCSFVNVVE